jgi:hypothetical protein
MKLRFLVLLPFVFLGPPVLAAQPQEPSDEDIERLLQATRAQSLLGAIVPQVEAAQQQQFEQIAAGKELSSEQKADIDRIRAKSDEIVRKTLDWEQMRPLYVDVYRKNFSRDDVRAITRFYESDAGQHMLDRNPLLMQQLMAAIQQKMVPMLQELETEMKDATAMPAPPVSPPQARRPAAAPAKKAKKSSTSSKKKSASAKKKKSGKAPAKKSPAKSAPKAPARKKK